MSRDPLPPETAGVVDQLVASAQATGAVPTLVAAVVRDGRVRHTACAGEPVGPDTQFRIGSITKTMTATMVLQLRDQGKLSLDDLLDEHLPGTPVGGVTLRQLLSHMSGLQREPAGDWWERAPGRSIEDLLAGLTPDKLGTPSGPHYSNLAYGLLGAVLERVTGQTWAALLEQRVLQPLDLRRTTYHPVEPFARGYVVHPWHGTLAEEPRYDSGAMAPAGQLWSTVTDLARWAAFLTGPDPAVLAPATMAQMCAPVVISDPATWSAGYGLGTVLLRHGERVFAGHPGSVPGYLAVLLAHRPTGTGVVAFANAYTLRGTSLVALGLQMLTEVLDREPTPVPPWRPASDPPGEVVPLLGRWWWMGLEYEVSWDSDAEELVVAALPAPRPGTEWRFTRQEGDRWRGTAGMNAGEVLAVCRGAGGGVEALDIASLRFTRTP